MGAGASDRRVAILHTVFLLADDTPRCMSGADRYLVELCRLLLELGYEPEIYQPGGEDFAYGPVKVRGLPWGEAEYANLPELNRQFHDASAGAAKAVYMAPFLAFPLIKPGAVVVSHGIYWDYPTHAWAFSERPLGEEWQRRLFYALTAPDLVVSVDTATLGWLRSIRPGHEHRQVYIPNFVDPDAFKPAKEEAIPRRLAVLYPRRLDWSRGLADAKAAAATLTRTHQDLEFDFVGRGVDERVEEEMRSWAATHPGCRYRWVPLAGMPEIYRAADIVLIPSRASEGTSLSCLEAMACGKSVIAGRVGGLTDLIIDGYNGRLLEITPENLVAAVEDLLADGEKRRRLGRNALATAEKFSLKIWKERWAAALARVWEEAQGPRASRRSPSASFPPCSANCSVPPLGQDLAVR